MFGNVPGVPAVDAGRGWLICGYTGPSASTARTYLPSCAGVMTGNSGAVGPARGRCPAGKITITHQR